MEDKVNELCHIADNVAKRLAKEYPAVEWDDIAQELKEYVWKNRTTLRVFHETDMESNPMSILYREGRKYCDGWVRGSAHTVANQAYSVDDVRRMLADALLFQEVINTYVPEWSKSYRPKNSRRANDKSLDDWDSIIIGTDVKLHMKYLRKSDRELLFRRFVLDDTETKRDPLSKAVSRAVERLTDKLNVFALGKSAWHEERPNGYIGAREVNLVVKQGTN